MSFFDRLFGAPTPEPDARRTPAVRSDDERAVERYRYLLQTAPPETIEQVHAEAFAKLTPEQRRLVYDELARTAPAGEAPADDQPATLARAATRSELRQPGTMERSLGGPSFGQMVGASLLGTVAGYVIGSALASAFLPPMDAGLTDAAGADAANADPGADAGGADAGADAGGFDAGGFDAGGFDAGGFGDFGDFGF
ncbi:hypothetical protein [Microcella frigidaquae]|uniref:DUF2076 domain-containing protein n=1 Tax=Microcella frigidaquae TaxID=424758 RepID=A0A840XK84_9MICO|nr:hypothetical protein [Microcella frigidaquae]MBB5617267.1 hypothetical protein [Microcella frigidaquae]NHN45034.1 hypothetical protein [Microcella frigidaquae]